MAKGFYCEENVFSGAVLAPIDVIIFVGARPISVRIMPERAVNGFDSEYKGLIHAVNAFRIKHCMCLC